MNPNLDHAQKLGDRKLIKSLIDLSTIAWSGQQLIGSIQTYLIFDEYERFAVYVLLWKNQDEKSRMSSRDIFTIKKLLKQGYIPYGVRLVDPQKNYKIGTLSAIALRAWNETKSTLNVDNLAYKSSAKMLTDCLLEPISNAMYALTKVRSELSYDEYHKIKHILFNRIFDLMAKKVAFDYNREEVIEALLHYFQTVEIDHNLILRFIKRANEEEIMKVMPLLKNHEVLAWNKIKGTIYEKEYIEKYNFMPQLTKCIEGCKCLPFELDDRILLYQSQLEEICSRYANAISTQVLNYLKSHQKISKHNGFNLML